MSAFRDHYVSSTLEKQQLPFLVKEMYQRKKKAKPLYSCFAQVHLHTSAPYASGQQD